MALTHATATRNAMADACVDLIDGGAGAGTLEFQTSGDVEVATITFSDPAFGTAASGTATMSGAPKQDTNATGGTMAKFKVFDSNSTQIFEGTVGTSGEDINFAGGVTVGVGDTVELTSLTYSAST